jgi:anti-sigma factor RsiW
MDDCQRTIGRLASYADKLLPAAEQADVERHLGRCRRCRDAAQRELGGRTVLREHARGLCGVPLPPGLRTRCEAIARNTSATAPPLVFASRRFASLTTLMAIVIGFFVFSLATHRSDTVLAAQLTADHAKCFRMFASDDSPDADAHRVERMLEEDYGWDLHVPPSSPASGIRLLGARRCLYVDGSVPHVMYRAGGYDMSLYVLDGVARPAANVRIFGHHSRVWVSGRRTYVLVWPAAAPNITPAVRYVMTEAR